MGSNLLSAPITKVADGKVGPGTEGYFSNLKVTPSAVALHPGPARPAVRRQLDATSAKCAPMAATSRRPYVALSLSPGESWMG